MMKEYRARINRVEDYIQENLESELSLDELAEIAAFSRTFGRRFGVSASQWRELGGQIPEVIDRIKAGWVAGTAGGGGLQPDPEIVPDSIEVVDTRNINVIYIRYAGPFQGDTELFAGLFGKLSRWAAARSLINPDTRSFCIVHDNPAITDGSRSRSTTGSTDRHGPTCIHSGCRPAAISRTSSPRSKSTCRISRRRKAEQPP